MLNYEECVNYMEGLSKFGSVYGLDTIRNFLNRLNNPQNDLKFVHVAGTNGKGSVCAYLTKILICAGYKIGTFNSPSVFTYNERILINAKQASDDIICKYINIVKEERDKMEKEGITSLPTSFEMELAAALLIFRDLNCDIVVLETGMGGRLDATNVVENKLLSIITAIDFDHTQYLGDTLEKIAQEKFGIVRDRLLTFKQSKEVMKVFKKAPKLYVTKEPRLLIATRNDILFQYGRKTYKIQMLGEHQLQNASLAIKAARILKRLGYTITEDNIKSGLFTTKWPGRLEKISAGGKLFILDGAHNPSGALTLKNAIKLHFATEKKSYVFGAFKDKDVDGVLKNMKEVLSTVYVASAPTQRALDVASLKNICEKYANNVITNASISEAINKAYKSDSEIIIIFGSLSILKEAKDYIRGING